MAKPSIYELVPTTYGTGPYYPAIRQANNVWYWPNISFTNEDEAYLHSKAAVKDAQNAAQEVINNWNIFPA